MEYDGIWIETWHIWRLIVSSFTRERSQIITVVFENTWKNKHFWPILTPHLTPCISREQKFAWTCNLYIYRDSYLSPRGEGIKSLGYVLRKFGKPPILTHFDPHLTRYLGNEKLSGVETWYTYEKWYYLPSLGDGTKSVCQFLRKLRKTQFWPILTPIWPPISGTKNGLDL